LSAWNDANIVMGLLGVRDKRFSGEAEDEDPNRER
jgi:hypothetical protein